jgi:hypothetical protein
MKQAGMEVERILKRQSQSCDCGKMIGAWAKIIEK